MKNDSVQYERQRHRTGIRCSHASNIVPCRAVSPEGLVHLIPVLTSEYLLPSQWVLVLAPTHLLPLLSEYLFSLRRKEQKRIRYVTIHFQDWCGPASPRLRNRAEVTVLMGEHKPYPVRFYYLRKSELSGIVYE